ncbi:MAG TPA: hypothetical protein VFT95_06135 [Micromonosporaceae bacterium]|nr:hypothetical protein [Micromonosporaceae bacterium]
MGRVLSGAISAFLVASSLSLFSAPARADDDELKSTLELSSGTVLAGGSKQVTFTVTNISDDELTDLRLGFLQTAWDHEKVNFPLDDEVCHPGTWTETECSLFPDPLPPGRSATFTTTFEAVDGAAPGPAGKLRAMVLFDMGGRDPGEITEFPLTIAGGPGPDLFAYAADVPPTGALEPGQTGPLLSAFANQGNVPATDITLTATLPAGAHFVSGQPGFEPCEFAERSVTCAFGDQVLTSSDGLIPIMFPVRLNDDAKRGVNLKGGKVEITGTPVAEAEQVAAKKAAPSFPRGTAAAADMLADVDLRDNDDRFTVVVAKAAQADPDPGGGAGGGNGVDDPTLPITGPAVTVLAGTGAALTAVGVLLLVAVRRRRPTAGRTARG